MFNNYKEFLKKYPYAHIIVISLFASFIGISIEYIVNKDFIGAGLYSALGLAVIEMLRIRRRKK
ncbi:hypothetical protein [Carnobacterium mobile]|uniref:hypothetical protein n=1 Tax=Carnobacterium mobile TaxID=2750 RepID=UPI000552E9A2|nr:hypothetical protein [Carnobacterium mobile]